MEQDMMRFSLTSATLWSGLPLAAAACGGPQLARRDPVPLVPSVAIVGATLWDGTGRGQVPNAVTVVRGDRVVCAGAAGECPVPANA